MSSFDALMQEAITVKRYIGESYNGGKTYETPVTIKGRLEWKQTRTFTPTGDLVMSEAVVYTTIRLTTGDILVISGVDWVVKAIHERKGLYSGTDHWEVYL